MCLSTEIGLYIDAFFGFSGFASFVKTESVNNLQ